MLASRLLMIFTCIPETLYLTIIESQTPLTSPFVKSKVNG